MEELARGRVPRAGRPVPGLIPNGLTILGGRPKRGKSWLMLQAGLRPGAGRQVPGPRPAPGQGAVLRPGGPPQAAAGPHRQAGHRPDGADRVRAGAQAAAPGRDGGGREGGAARRGTA